jgi:trimeric autotransporter adhesin
MHLKFGFAGRTKIFLCLWFVSLLATASVSAAEYRGQIVFNGLGVPGAVVTAARGDQKFSTVTDAQGGYLFPDLPDGVWNIRVEMQAFSSLQLDVTVGPDTAAGQWELKLLPIEQIQGIQSPVPSAAQTSSAGAATATAQSSPAKSSNPKKGAAVAPTNTQTPFQRADVNAAGSQTGMDAASAAPPSGGAFGDQNPADLNQRAADGLTISGTANNSASSPYALSQAFGNTRRGVRSLYSGSVGFNLDNSALDARSYSLNGADTEQPAYNHMRGEFTFQGPLRIPHLVRNGPTVYVNYQITRNRNVRTESGLVPTAAERDGDLSQSPGQIYNPITNVPFDNNRIPSDQISRQAKALLNFYPLPNFTGNTRYNYQIPVAGVTHQDSVQTYMSKSIGRKNQLIGIFSLNSARSDNPTLLGFLDTSRSLNYSAIANWRHSFTQRFFSYFSCQFIRGSNRTVPFFANRENVSGLAGITGNNQDAVNWGPPALMFSSGLASLSDAMPSSIHNQTGVITASNLWNHGAHGVTFGGEYRREQLNIRSQQNPRGSFTFTGLSMLSSPSGALLPGNRNDFARFLLGMPDTLSIAFGNADKYFRSSSLNAYIADDWRVNPGLTLNIGLRWEYWSPITELYGRLVNLDIVRGFSAVAPVVGKHPVGSLTGTTYADSLVHGDRHAFQPRIGFSWRPMAASSMVVRGGYGIYYNGSPYQSIAMWMAQQSPLSKNLSLQNTVGNPLTLANGFNAPPNTTANTFAVDPNLRIGYLHTWQLSIQRDLPFALQITAAYQGTRGRHALQQFLPNTYPIGALNPCLTCPRGFIYLTSNGSSSRESGTVQLRRRLRSGLGATMEYTFSKSIDDAAPGGRQTSDLFVAQNWLNLRAERALSSFDRRHHLNAQFQYTSGMGIKGGTLMKGWRGILFKGWTVSNQINVDSGLPLTPIYMSAVAGTGVTGTVRPNYTGADIKAAPRGLHLNPAAYTAPATGQWGNAGRNSIPGPSQFALSASLGRSFQTGDRNSLDLRVDAGNVLNHVTFPSWDTTIGSAQFGLPLTANSMRNITTSIRWKF